MLAEYFAEYKERHPGRPGPGLRRAGVGQGPRASRHRGDRHGVRGRQVGHPGRRRGRWSRRRPTSRSRWCSWRRGRWGCRSWSTAACAATMEHCRRSGGGLWFDSYRRFEVDRRPAGRRRGTCGRHWARPAAATRPATTGGRSIIDRYTAFLDGVVARGRRAPVRTDRLAARRSGGPAYVREGWRRDGRAHRRGHREPDGRTARRRPGERARRARPSTAGADERELLRRLRPPGARRARLTWAFDDAMRRIDAPGRAGHLDRARGPACPPTCGSGGARPQAGERVVGRRGRGRWPTSWPPVRPARRGRGVRRSTAPESWPTVSDALRLPGRPGRAARGRRPTRSGPEPAELAAARARTSREWADAVARLARATSDRAARWSSASRATALWSRRWPRPAAPGGGGRAPRARSAWAVDGRLRDGRGGPRHRAGRGRRPPGRPAGDSRSPAWSCRLRRPGRPGRQGRPARAAVRALVPGGHAGRAGRRPGGVGRRPSPPGRDLLPGRPLHPETWSLVLRTRAGWRRPVDGAPGGRRDRPRRRGPDRHGRRTDGRHPPVRSHAPPPRRGGGAHPGPAGPAGGRRRPVDDLHRDPRSGDRGRDPSLPRYEPGRRRRRRARLPVRHPNRTSPAGWPRRPEPVVVNYHSITPPAFFGPWNNGIARLQVGCPGRAGRSGAAGGARASPCPEFDDAELRGRRLHRDTAVDPGGQRVGPPGRTGPRASLERLPARQPGPGPRWLSVGRLAPTRPTTRPSPPCSWPGPRPIPTPTSPWWARRSSRPTPAALRRYAADARPGRRGRVRHRHQPTPSWPPATGAADVLVMLSEHEGFGVPWSRRWATGCPMVAFDAGAVAEVLGGRRGAARPTRARAGWPARWPGCWPTRRSGTRWWRRDGPGSATWVSSAPDRPGRGRTRGCRAGRTGR